MSRWIVDSDSRSRAIGIWKIFVEACGGWIQMDPNPTHPGSANLQPKDEDYVADQPRSGAKGNWTKKVKTEEQSHICIVLDKFLPALKIRNDIGYIELSEDWKMQILRWL
ncbi:hypothetical protein F442_23062 [Phytophthora nicotianae P10297]|uniref:Uncharacterized protein n=1 Tax=Phytophthora nicotianae P10297 TaxID=1317064 RepID=W2XXT1_PHYNI|nr:hypothetical protein F442_23062 [Phytophthora nicotianae P10297]